MEIYLSYDRPANDNTHVLSRPSFTAVWARNVHSQLAQNCRHRSVPLTAISLKKKKKIKIVVAYPDRFYTVFPRKSYAQRGKVTHSVGKALERRASSSSNDPLYG